MREEYQAICDDCGRILARNAAMWDAECYARQHVGPVCDKVRIVNRAGKLVRIVKLDLRPLYHFDLDDVEPDDEDESDDE